MTARIVRVAPGSPEWLEWRRSGYGASDAPTLLAGDERAWRELHAEKLGLIDEEPGSEAMKWGLRLEDTIAQAYTEQTGEPVQRVPFGLQHPELEFMRASLDRRRRRGRIVVELKAWGTKTADFGAPGSDAVPDRMYAQVQQQLAVTGYEAADLAVFFGLTKRLEVYAIGRDGALIDSLIAVEEAAWAYVARGEMPPYPGEPDHRIPIKADELAADPELVESVAMLEIAQDAEHAAGEYVEQLRRAIRERLDEYGGSRGELPDGRRFSIAHRYEKPRTRTEWQHVAAGYRHKLEELGVPADELDFPVTALTRPEAQRRPLRVTIAKPKEAVSDAA
jgi:putative phage-type endonuclease